MSEKEENDMKKIICILLCVVMLLVSCGINDNEPLNSHEPSGTDALDASSAESPNETDPPAPPVVEPRKTEFIESPEPMRYALGGEYSFYLPNRSSGDTRQDGMSVIVCAVECLPDTYYDFADLNKTEKRLVRMKTLKNLGKFKVSEEFYLMVPVDFMTDFTAYGSFVINDLLQYGYEGFVLYNKTLGCAERFDLALCACTPYDWINAERMIAFDENGNFDISLWYSTEAWKEESQGYIEYIAGDGKYALVRDGYTLAQTEEKLLEQINESQEYAFMHTISDANEDEIVALEYVLSAENGLFVPEHKYYTHYAPYEVTYRTQRYIEGYPTNEKLSINRDGIKFSTVKFSAEDIENMPDLASAMKEISEEFQNGNIKPPHILANVSEMGGSFGVFGWYEKSENGVYGVVRVAWKYWNDDRYFLDDKYYVITSEMETCEAIDRDDLLKLINNDLEYVYTGKYNVLGKDYK
jgi:hypothetical protein